MSFLGRMKTQFRRIVAAAIVTGTVLPNALFANTDPDMMLVADTVPMETPEIDPALTSGALTLLLGAVLIVTDRLRNRSCTDS